MKYYGLLKNPPVLSSVFLVKAIIGNSSRNDHNQENINPVGAGFSTIVESRKKHDANPPCSSGWNGINYLCSRQKIVYLTKPQKLYRQLNLGTLRGFNHLNASLKRLF